MASTRLNLPGNLKMITSRGALAVHLRIIEDFETRILSGLWHTGFRIPTEHEIAAEYNCSRPTVAKALMLLEQKGMIMRRKRAGSFVRRPPAQSVILQALDPATEISARNQKRRYEVLSRVVRRTTSGDRAKLRMRSGRVLSIVTRDWADDVIYCLEERLFNLDTIPDAEHIDFDKTPPSEWLVLRVPWRTGDNSIFAEEASESHAEALQVRPGAALLCIERQVYVSTGYLSYSITRYPASQQRLRAHYDTSAIHPTT
ncbi:GntR family histidine utilization transcriptional repressor [Chelatococcus asaccharovorans]|uniref:GntR family histidine utilization transcriptional repressor n=2 Tax=Chelatococcus asaccharovorans TaxID=28210 RepID=A0A2V3UAT2_9HYPH|nr:GntR family histidine utilization transcriptional repressor [Chelatococcus asaccharovorans]